MHQPLPQTRDVVLIGGGHAHALLLRRWGMRGMAGARLTLINPHPTAPYTGMLPGHVAGHYPRAALEIDLVRLARHAGARLVLDRAVAIDRAARQVILGQRGPVAYDIASIDVGLTSDMPDLLGFGDHGVAAKPLDAYARRWDRFTKEWAPDAPGICVIGGGVAGMELAMAMARRLPSCPITVLEASEHALPGMGRMVRAALLRKAADLGVSIIPSITVAEVTQTGVTLRDGRHVTSGFTVGAAGGRALDWLRDTGLHLTDGYVTVGPSLQSVTDPLIFAVGDCAHMRHAPRPKAGVFAVRQAPVLHHNIQAALAGGRMQPYRPQRNYLKLISTGGESAVADRFGLPLQGSLMWRWKDRIDRRFMARLTDLPHPPAPALPRIATPDLAEAMGPKPLCGGCGAKMGGADLASALAGLPAPRRADLRQGRGDDAAVLAHGDRLQVISTDHLRSFTADPWLMARIAAVHALGDVWAMGAAPQIALASITLPRLSPELQRRTLAEIMASVSEIFRAEGADIAGGHTSIGDELTIGFTVTGMADRIIPKAGARAGDALVLTRALGSGIIMAAEMARAATPGFVLGDCVAGALATMARPQGDTARALAAHAHAMTDVTGFGLAGHLMEMLEGAGLGATLMLDRVPLMPGAAFLAERGHRSSLHGANRGTAARMVLPDPLPPAAELLFDPQTAGGLLAAVPPGALAALGDVAVIGYVTEGPPLIRLS